MTQREGSADEETFTVDDVIGAILAHDAEALGVPVEVRVEGFHIDDERRLNWVVGKITGKRAEAARTMANALAMVAELTSQADALENRFADEIEVMAKQLLIEREGLTPAGELRKKMLKLFGGKVAFTKTADRIAVPNGTKAEKSALVAWCREMFPDTPELVRVQTVEDVLITEIKPLLEVRTVTIPGADGEGIVLESVVIAGTEEPVAFATVKPAETMSIKE